MKIILEQFGAIILSALVAGLIIFLICNNLFWGENLLGFSSKLVGEQSSSVMGTGFDDSVLISQNLASNMKIQSDFGGKITCGEKIYMNEYLKITSSKILDPQVQLIGIIDKNGDECSIPYDDKGYYLYFEEAGIYEISFKVLTLDRKDRYGVFKVVVNKEK